MKLKTLFTTCNIHKLLESLKSAYFRHATSTTSSTAIQTDALPKKCAPNPLTSKDKRRIRPQLIAEYGMTCFWCKHALEPETLTIEHYIPLSKGGTNKLENLRLACVSCNTKRGNAMPEHTLRAIAKRSYVRFPSHWKAPKYRLGQLVDKGQIIGVEYHLPRATRSSQLSEGWHYTVLLDDQGYGVEILKESDIEPAQLEKINTKIDELNALTAHLSKQLEEAEKF